MAIKDGPEYEDLMEGIYKAYAERAIALLTKIRDVCREDGLTADDEIYDMSGDDYEWGFRVWRGTEQIDDECIDISLEIAEQRDYDDDEGFGLNFAIDIVEYGGIIVGGLAPFNYTEDCWVDARDSEAVEARFRLIEDSYIGEIPALIQRESA